MNMPLLPHELARYLLYVMPTGQTTHFMKIEKTSAKEK